MNYNLIYSHKADKNLIIPPRSEILRYLGEKGEENEVLKNLIDEIQNMVSEKALPTGTFVLKKIMVHNEKVSIGDIFFSSQKLAKNLAGCHSAIVFSLTIGSSVDRLMQSLVSKPAAEFVASATGSAFVESYADLFNKEIKDYFGNENKYLRPRFSPGYGDFSHSAQKDIINMTDASRRCGIYLTKALMLTPTKSVTGVIGIGDTNCNCPSHGCEACDKTDCISRRS
ncbi:MAG: Vitamin B12 dependent methionine synthase activation subunit [Clostridia bacterium]|nr:Vitamin B12 dependent methionine synthase activation subunit [Clostridia bacterium]